MSRNRFPFRDLWTFLTIICTVGLVGCDSTTSSAKPVQRMQIVATTGMVADLVRQLAGEHADVSSLMGPGVDPHLYKPTRNDVRRLLDADVVVYSGLHLEGRMVESLEQVGKSGKLVIAVTDGLKPEQIRTPPDDPNSHDPHVWMDVALWRDCSRHVAKKLAEFDSVHAAEYEQRRAAYEVELTELDAYVRQVIASIPESQRIMVTAHDAFEYFSQAYGIQVRSVQGVTTDSEAGINDVNALVDLVVERKLPAIFIESSVNPKTIEAVVEGARSRGATVKEDGPLYSDALGEAGTYEGTYLGMIDANATLIAKALGGTPPAKGWRGQLTVK